MPTVTGAEYLARTLERYGVSTVFFVPTILSKTLYEMEQHTAIQRVVTHGEKSAAYMADGYARASNRPGVAMAQNIGAANLAAGLRDAYMGCSPVVAMTGGPYDASRSRSYYQEIEDLPMFKPVTRWSGQIRDGARLPDMLAHAFRMATVGKPGPTHLELAGHTGDVVEDALVDTEISVATPVAVPGLRSAPDAGVVAAAAELLRSARRPVLVAGGGVRSSGAGAQLVALAERLGCPMATSLNGKDTVPGDHPLLIGVPGLYARRSANEVLLEADLVFYVGSQTGSQLTLSWTVPPLSTQVIHLDIDPTELGRHYPRTLPMLGDARTGLQLLLHQLGDVDGDVRSEWMSRASLLTTHWRQDQTQHVERGALPMRPEQLIGALSDHLPPNSLLVADTGHAGMWTGGYLDLRSAQQGYIRAAGSLGWGLPAAIGAQLARPDLPVVLFTGDGGLWYHVAELETAARWNVPVTIVVNNNRALNQEIWPYTAAYGGRLHGRHSELWHFTDVDLAAMAETMGVRGLTVTKPSEVRSALDQAFSFPGPTLINVITDIEALAPKGSAQPAWR